jgi:HEAT repeat protein
MGNPMFRNWLWLAILMAILFGGRAEALQTEAEVQAGTDLAASQLEAEIAQLQASIAKTQNEVSKLQVALSRYTPEHAKHAKITSTIAELQDELQRLELALNTAQQRQDAATAICIYIGPRPALDTESPGKVYREQLAELDLLVTVDRDFAEAERRLAVLRLRAMGPPAFDGQREVVTLATSRLAEVQLAQRAPDRALETAQNLLTRRPVDALATDEWFRPAKQEWIELEREWLQDARLISLRKLAAKELERRSAAPVGTEVVVPAEVTDEIWRDIQEGDGGLVRAMGTAAVPALEQLVVLSIDRVQPSAVADPQRDPLTWLMEVAPLRAVEMMAQHVDQRSIVWRKRILRVMNARADLWSNMGNWNKRQTAARQFVGNDDWQQILDVLASDLALWEDTRGLISWSAEVVQWTPVQESVVRGLMLDGNPEHFALITSPGRGPFWQEDTDAERALLRDALNDSRPEVREFAASRLSDAHDFVAGLGSGDPVVVHAFAEASVKQARERLRKGVNVKDLDPERRELWIEAMLAQLPGTAIEDRILLAVALTQENLREYVSAEQLTVIVNDPDPGVRVQIFNRFDLGDKESALPSDREFHLLRALLGDPSEDIRIMILRTDSWQQAPTRLTLDELLQLAGDESAQVRATLAWLQITDEATRAALYTRLAADSHEDVVGAVDSKVQFLVREDDATLPGLMPYFEARVENPHHPALPNPDMPRGNAFEFLKDVDGFATALNFARENPEAPATRSLVRYWNFVRGQSQLQTQLLLGQSAEDLAYLLKAAAAQLDGPVPSGVRTTNGVPYFEFENSLRELNSHDTPELERAMQMLADDRSASRVIRLHAYAWLMANRPESSLDACLAFVREPIWEGATLKDQNLSTAIQSLSRFTALEYRNRFALQIVESPDIPRLIASELAENYKPASQGGVEVSRAMLKRWLTLDTNDSPASDALRHIGGIPGEVEPALMRRALRIGSLSSAALFAFAQLKDPQYLPDLREALNPTWIGYAESRHSFAKDVAFTISQYMTDEAAEVLLEGVGIAETDEVRQACFDALERIRLYQEARERIGRHSSSAEKRDEAVRELVTMLDDPDPVTVVAAIRGLAALGAIDELPTLIRLMKHADKDVKAAAQAAVARLTEPAPKSDGSDAPGDR